jgi:hypothetical protein
MMEKRWGLGESVQASAPHLDVLSIPRPSPVKDNITQPDFRVGLKLSHYPLLAAALVSGF